MSNIVMAQYEDHASTGNDGTGIAGSAHDFSDGTSLNAGVAESWNTTGELCRVCHVPHDDGGANLRYLNGVLWNRDLTTQTFTIYTSPSFDGVNHGQPSGISQLCLGCHDGSIAIDAFGQYGGTAGNEIDQIYGGALADFLIPNTDPAAAPNDIRGTHPISMDFTGTELNPLTTPVGTSSYTIDDILFANQVQCASCHDVHNQESVPGTHLLRVDQTGSGLCLTCHIK
jgi:predicted CXXCH cytochrome family protein